jgi:hypothetical protein
MASLQLSESRLEPREDEKNASIAHQITVLQSRKLLRTHILMYRLVVRDYAFAVRSSLLSVSGLNVL